MNDYNLFEFTKLIERIVDAHPLINSFFVGKYTVNESDNVVYPALALTINAVTNQSSTLTFDCNLLYADRLTDRRDNETSIQSVGVSSIVEVLNALNAHTLSELDESYTITPFSEQFADNCAGVFTRINVVLPSYIGECEWINSECITCK